MSRLQKTEELLLQCEKGLARIKEIRAELRVIETNRAKLADYYQSQYKEDYESANRSEHHYRILDQDSIWNVLDDQYREKINLLKEIAQTL